MGNNALTKFSKLTIWSSRYDVLALRSTEHLFRGITGQKKKKKCITNLIMRQQQTNSNWETIYKITILYFSKMSRSKNTRAAEKVFPMKRD